MGAATTVSLSDTVAEILTKVGTWFPAILALLALNAIVLLALAVVALVMCCRRKKPAGGNSPRMRARSVLGRSSPMPMGESTSFSAGQGHVYEPVSMALTEDTLFGPPSPGYKDGAKGFKRPQSYASSSRMSNVYQADAHGKLPMDDPFTPPVPAFSRYDGDTLRGGDRPKSVA